MAEIREPFSIVCFGDSLTWGFNPVDQSRYPRSIRWTGQLQELLGPDFLVVEEGLNGRTTVFDDPVLGNRNGLAHLDTVLKSHRPIDLLVMMLGTNDLQVRFGLGADEIAMCFERLVRLAQSSDAGRDGKAPAILLMAPPAVKPFAGTRYESQFERYSEQSIVEVSASLKTSYAALAERTDVAFLDTSTIVECSDVDAIHLDAEMQAPLAQAIAERIIGPHAEALRLADGSKLLSEDS